ncbi:MAG TPA: hypothetical protein PK691_04000 [Thermomicrobiales bacterium]|nr:hypothetical protein [Thermomicrobiales bacterium]HRA47083.1 hypothetical protein [Thermomicrobiales bacterium]
MPSPEPDQLFLSMCRLVGQGTISTITIVPPAPPDADMIRTLRIAAYAHRVLLVVDEHGGIVLRGGQTEVSPQMEKPSRSPMLPVRRLTTEPGGAA